MSLIFFYVYYGCPGNELLCTLIILGTSVSKKFREGDLHLTTSLVFNPLNPEMPPEEEAEWVHEVLSPTLYELGNYNYLIRYVIVI